MAGIVDTADRAQRRFPPVGLPLAVVYKFFDDQGNYLAAMITYFAFVAIFPLLLLGTTILGFVLQGNPALEQQVLDSALAQFPVIGDDLNTPAGLTGSAVAVVVSALIALYGATGLGTGLQNAMNVAWSVPRNSRPNPFLLRAKSLVLLLAAGLALGGVTAVSIFAQVSGLLDDLGAAGPWLVTLLSTVVISAGMTLVFRLAAARQHAWHKALPGAIFVAIGWQALQVASTALVNQVVAGTSSVNATFGVVLGLLGVIYVASLIAVFGMEINVVVTRRLWPRALLTPFTDSVDLTEADRRAYTSYARAQRHKGFEEVSVDFATPPHHRSPAASTAAHRPQSEPTGPPGSPERVESSEVPAGADGSADPAAETAKDTTTDTVADTTTDTAADTVAGTASDTAADTTTDTATDPATDSAADSAADGPPGERRTTSASG